MLRAWLLLRKSLALLNKKEIKRLKRGLEDLYKRYNKRCYVSPDPLEFLYNYKNPLDREVVGLIASSLAYGRVTQILSAVRLLLKPMGKGPRNFLLSISDKDLEALFSDYNHRFTKGPEIVAFLKALKRAIKKYGSLEGLFSRGDSIKGKDVERTVSRVTGAVHELLSLGGLEKSFLLPDPLKKSACKRLFLFLRWMVRRDEVDPGGWKSFSPSELIVPLDTHMFHISRSLGLTQKRQANLKTAIEITNAFRAINPEDPVKYDFVLTRFGIRDELSRAEVPGLVLG